MYAGGDAAEQMVRMSLQGVEVTARITGEAAKNITILLYSILKEEKKTKGKARLTNMLKSGKELKVFTVRNADLKEFTQNAKKYGVLYCVLADRSNKDPNAQVDIIARAEDAGKINRIVERFNLASVDTASIMTEIGKERAGSDMNVPEKNMSDDQAEALAAELLGKPIKKEEPSVNPELAKTTLPPPSEPISEQPERFTEGTTKPPQQKSIRRDIREIELKRKRAMMMKGDGEKTRSQDSKSVKPQSRKKKSKGKNQKER